MHRLLTIPFSHYNEKARWGLDRYHQAYREERWLPGLHVLPIAWAARGAEGERASPGATPLLITTDGRKLGDSTTILRWLDRHRPGEGPPLYPVPASLELEQRFDRRLGPQARRLAYGWLMQRPESMFRLARANVPLAQARTFERLWPVIAPTMQRGLGLDEARVAQARAELMAEVASISALLRGRRWLAGGRFSAADLTLACLLSPVLLVQRDEGFGATLPSLDEVPDEVAALAASLRGTRAGEHALRLFAEERR